MADAEQSTKAVVIPGKLRGTPTLIERLWPAQKISAEAQKERKAGSGQTLTALGSYWKGRKPLVLVRACVLGSILPATDNPAEDLAVFEALMSIDDDAFFHRDTKTKPAEVAQILFGAKLLNLVGLRKNFRIRNGETDPSDDQFLAALGVGTLIWHPEVSRERRRELFVSALSTLPYMERVARSLRPEELPATALESIWPRVNRHLGTNAFTLQEVVQQLGIMRFGRHPYVADTFSGGGSIPFEAARTGCQVRASDLNPIACMLSWGALNILGASPKEAEAIWEDQQTVAQSVDAIIEEFAFEHDEDGNRAKSYLYCLEGKCPTSGWMVPMLPSMVVSNNRNVVAVLIPDTKNKRYDIEIKQGVSQSEMAIAEKGTVQSGYLIHSVEGEVHRNSIKTIRGDYRTSDGETGNALRQWTLNDVSPRQDDIFQERLYCIQWATKASLDGRLETFFTAVRDEDIEREQAVEAYVRENLADWHRDGFVPTMKIETGYENEGPIRTNGWAYWQHMFTPRQILYHALIAKHTLGMPHMKLLAAKCLDYCNKSSQWRPRGEYPEQLFSGPSLKTMFNWGARSFLSLQDTLLTRFKNRPVRDGVIINAPASAVAEPIDLFVTDPPYADAVRYEEITEFFIAWLRQNPPSPFDGWVWDSRRALAIKGDGEDFRREMVNAYRKMAENMSPEGLQVVMFTHQSGSVWADMAQIFWGAGLQVRSAWYIATETTSELKKGGYVQGTVILVLRKRATVESGYEDEIAQEVRAEVARQIDTLVGLNQSLKGGRRIENLFEDADLQMAGYAAALRVLTGYTTIDGKDMTAEVSRPRKKGEKGFVEQIIDFAVQVANEHMVPGNLSARIWGQLSGTERFYLKMIDLEAAGLSKLDNYQNLSRAFRVPDYSVVMADTRANAARLKTALDFKGKTGFEIRDFGDGIVRAVLYGIWELSKESDPQDLLQQLRDMVENYLRRREDMIEVAEYIATMRGREDGEGRFAILLANLLRNERL